MKLERKNLQPKPDLIKTRDALRGTEIKKDDFYFDPRSEIAEEERRNMEKVMNWEIRKNRGDSFNLGSVLENIIQYLIILPERRKNFKISGKILLDLEQNVEIFWDTMDTELISFNNYDADDQRQILESNICFSINTFWLAKMLLSEAAFKVNLLPELERPKGKLFKKIIQQEWHNISNSYKLKALMLFPEMQQEIKLTDDDMKNLQNFDQRGYDDYFVSEAGELSLIYPEFRNKHHLETEKLKRVKDNMRQIDIKNGYQTYISNLLYLYVLSAERAEITPDGRIVITPKTKPLQTVEPLPQRPV